MMSLVSALIQLSAIGPTETIPLYLGKATHAWFLSRIKKYDPQLSEALHVPNQDRPFTMSDVWGPGIRRYSRNRVIYPNLPIYLRVTSFWPQLTDLLISQILPELPETITLGGTLFRVETFFAQASQVSDPKFQVWAGETTFEQLVARYTLQTQLPRSIRFRFASPTVFRSNRAYVPLPLPRLVFEGLVRRWNTFSPIQIHEEVIRYAKETIAISRYRLQTKTVFFGENGGKGAYPGFVGDCTFALRHHDRYWMGLVHLLAAFAFYAGVGKNTTMGLGQTRLVSVRE